MARKSLKLIVLTGSDRPEVRSAWQSLLPYLKQTDGIEVVGEYPRSKDIEDTIDADMVVVPQQVPVAIKCAYLRDIRICRDKCHIERFAVFHDEGIGANRGANVFCRIGLYIDNYTLRFAPLRRIDRAIDSRRRANPRNLVARQG